MIEVKDLSFAYGGAPVLRKVSCLLPDGGVTGVIGPNGAGKSTLLRLCMRMLKPDSGSICLNGQPVSAFRAKAFAREAAFLPQNRPVPQMTVEELVRLGRFAHAAGSGQAVEEALRQTGLTALSGRDVSRLSGGQRQMAFLAMLLAQGSPHVLLDEPFTHLDIGAQLDVAQVLGQMKADGKCVAVVMHDMTLLDAVCDRVILLDGGEITFVGQPQECLHSPAFEKAFGVKVVEKTGIVFERA